MERELILIQNSHFARVWYMCLVKLIEQHNRIAELLTCDGSDHYSNLILTSIEQSAPAPLIFLHGHTMCIIPSGIVPTFGHSGTTVSR